MHIVHSHVSDDDSAVDDAYAVAHKLKLGEHMARHKDRAALIVRKILENVAQLLDT